MTNHDSQSQDVKRTDVTKSDDACPCCGFARADMARLREAARSATPPAPRGSDPWVEGAL